MTRRRCTQARRRPVVLFGALLAPAILAGGLLAGEIRGLGLVGARVVEGGGRVVALEPVLVPAPDRPDRRYEGVMPAPVREKSEKEIVSEERRESAPVEVEREEVEPEEPVTPAPVRTQGGCPGEWVDTWLWELCRDREQERAGGSWVPGI